jgi:poly(3-hydroxyalkanoate) depolymerase
MSSCVRTIDVRGQPVHIAIRTGSGTPLLVMNGIGANLELLQPFVDKLDLSIGVIRFDVPGVGGSPAPRFPYRLVWLAALVRRLLGVLGEAQVDVLGLSWGGALAQQFALQYRSRCRRLVLVNTSAGTLMLPGRPHILARLASPRRYMDQAYMASIAPTLYGGRIDEALARAFAQAVRPGAKRGYYYQLLAGVGWTSLPWLWTLRQPTLIVAGDNDPLVPPANARVLHRLIPHSRVHVFHGGHLGLVAQADEVAPVIARFLRE